MHSILQLAPFHNRNVLFEGRTEAFVLHYAIREGETIQY